MKTNFLCFYAALLTIFSFIPTARSQVSMSTPYFLSLDELNPLNCQKIDRSFEDIHLLMEIALINYSEGSFEQSLKDLEESSHLIMELEISGNCRRDLAQRYEALASFYKGVNCLAAHEQNLDFDACKSKKTYLYFAEVITLTPDFFDAQTLFQYSLMDEGISEIFSPSQPRSITQLAQPNSLLLSNYFPLVESSLIDMGRSIKNFEGSQLEIEFISAELNLELSRLLYLTISVLSDLPYLSDDFYTIEKQFALVEKMQADPEVQLTAFTQAYGESIHGLVGTLTLIACRASGLCSNDFLSQLQCSAVKGNENLASLFQESLSWSQERWYKQPRLCRFVD